MTLQIVASASTGLTLFATAQQIVGGTLGDEWNVSTSSWVTKDTASIADLKITLTEGTAQKAQSYTGGVGTTLGTYTGDVIIRIHDDNSSDVTIGSELVYLSSGGETTIGTIATATVSPVQVAKDRTWRLRKSGEYSIAPETIEVTVGSTTTLAMDFRSLLNPATDLTGTPTAVVSEVVSGTAPGLSNVALSQDRTQVHVDAVSAVSGRYKLKFTAATTDGQTFVGYGWLVVN